MGESIRSKETVISAPPNSAAARDQSLTLRPLTDADEREVHKFLGACHTVDAVYMTGLINDNGMESPFNRGAFFAVRDGRGRLEGISLIGHAMLFETRTERALASLASLAQHYTHAHVVMGEQEKMESFWKLYSAGGQQPRLICRELLFEQRHLLEARMPVRDLRRATLDDLPQLLLVQSRLAWDESGVNPLEADPEGFRLRMARRVEQGRVWVWIERERLIFKADVMTETADVIYLEGIYVHPEERGKGYGLRCMSQLSRTLLARARSISLLVNERNKDAQIFFFKSGFKLRGCYDTFFLQPKDETELFTV